MIGERTALKPPPIRRLDWDSAHFGFPVALVLGTEPREALEVARRNAIRLVYWEADGNREAPIELLREFAGLRVDRKATYVLDGPVPPPTETGASSSIRVREYSSPEATTRLLALSVAAGAFSRFRVDPRLPQGTFESLYETWMRRSTAGELADAVLVACSPDAEDELLGVVTVAVREGSGRIGLISVLDGARGRGVGSRLIEAAHEWFRSHGVPRASVVTQLDNLAACRLYERWGYRLGDVKNFYHFWPLDGGGNRP